MNINTEKGSKIRFMAKGGMDIDFAKGILVVGQEYTVESIEVHKFDSIDIQKFVSYVTLKGFPGKHFNTVLFENIDKPIFQVGQNVLITIEGFDEQKATGFMVTYCHEPETYLVWVNAQVLRGTHTTGTMLKIKSEYLTPAPKDKAWD